MLPGLSTIHFTTTDPISFDSSIKMKLVLTALRRWFYNSLLLAITLNSLFLGSWKNFLGQFLTMTEEEITITSLHSFLQCANLYTLMVVDIETCMVHEH